MVPGDALTVSATYDVTASISNTVLLVGVYDADNRLIQVFYSMEDTMPESRTLAVGLTVPAGADYIKLFSWASLRNLMLMEQAVIFSAPGN